MRRSSQLGTNFVTIWAGESVSLVGAQVTAFALPFVAVVTLDANALDMGLLSASGSLAVILLGLSMGVWADRWVSRTAMVFANLSRAVLLAAVPVAYLLGVLNLPLLLLVSFGVGAFTLLFDSAMSSYIPALVGPGRLVKANSWMQSSVSIADTAGPGLAGLLVQALGAPLAIVADGVSYLVGTAALLRSPRLVTTPDADTAAEAEDHHWKSVRRGLRKVLSDKVQRPLVLASAHFNFFTAMFFALYLLFLVKGLGFSPWLIGLLNVTGGVAGLAAAGISSGSPLDSATAPC